MVRVGQVETVSLQQDFYRQLGKIRNQYSWQIDEDNKDRKSTRLNSSH